MKKFLSLKKFLSFVLLLAALTFFPGKAVAQQYGQVPQVLGLEEPKRVHRVVSADIGGVNLGLVGIFFLATSVVLFYISRKFKFDKRFYRKGGEDK